MANVITGIRIACSLTLIFCPTFSTWFYVFYIVGGISDIFDGIVARCFGTETRFGARLDTIADTVFVWIVLIKVVLSVSVLIWLIVWIACLAVIKGINLIGGFLIHKRFISEHTVMNKICGVLLFAVPLYIGQFPRLPSIMLMILTCVAATFAAVQEGYYVLVGKEIG